MKAKFISLIALIAIITLFPASLYANDSDSLVGTWVGKCKFRVALDIQKNDSGVLNITYYNLDGRVIPFKGVIEETKEENKYSFRFNQIGVVFKGEYDSEKETLDLMFIVGQNETPVLFTKEKSVLEVERRKNFILPDGMNSRAPMELAMWSFLEGDWEGKHTKPLGGGKDGDFLLIWIGEWILDGNAMKNTSKTWVIRSNGEKGQMTQYGMDIRTYNPQIGKFEHTYTNAFSGRINKINWVIAEDEIHSEPSEWLDFEGYNMNIIKFRNISENHFTWSIDKSFDKGKTWEKDYIVIENVRVN